MAVSTPELGRFGPILGTIHASKGREASDVILMLPREQSMPDKSDFLEEGRVLYVGATRAMRRLATGTSPKHWAQRLGGGRVFRRIQGGAQVEIGREGDFDRAATVSRALHDSEEACRSVQDWLAGFTEEDAPAEALQPGQGDWDYRVCTPGVGAVCQLSQTVNHDLFEVAKRIGNPKGAPPAHIKYLWVTGSTTVCLPADDPRLAELHEPHATSGFFLAPIVRGLVPVYFRTSMKHGGKW